MSSLSTSRLQDRRIRLFRNVMAAVIVKPQEMRLWLARACLSLESSS